MLSDKDSSISLILIVGILKDSGLKLKFYGRLTGWDKAPGKLGERRANHGPTQTGLSGRPPINPLAPILVALLAAATLWPLSHFFGVGTGLFALAVGAILFYGGGFVLILLVAGIVFGAVKLFRWMKRGAGPARQERSPWAGGEDEA
jgi:hypothetical protein